MSGDKEAKKSKQPESPESANLFLQKPMTRRQAIGTMGKAAVVAGVAVAAAGGVGGYMYYNSLQNTIPTYSGPTEDVTFLLEFLPFALHSGMYAAVNQGFFKNQGINITIQPGAGSKDTMTKIAAGTADFGFGDVTVAFLLRSQNANLKIVGTTYQKNPMAVATLASKGIKKPSDLVGKTMGVGAGQTVGVIFPAFLKANNIDPSQVKVVTVAPPAQPSALATGQIDGLLTFWLVPSSLISVVQQANPSENVTPILFGDYGLNMATTGFCTTDNMIQKKPDLVKRLLIASYQGMEWAYQNQEKAIDIMHSYLPQINVANFLVDLKQDFLSWPIGTMESQGIKGTRLGIIDQSLVQKCKEVATQYLGLTQDIPLSDVYTTQFLT